MGIAVQRDHPKRKRPRKAGLSRLEENVLQMLTVGRRLTRHGLGQPPSQRDIACWLGCHANNVVSILDRLEGKGYIRRSDRGLSRAVEVLR